MAKLTKKQKALVGKVESTKLYPLMDAIGIVKECATAKFDESIDVAVQLGIDAKKSDQVVRGAVVLPNGTGKTARVAVFAQGAKAEEAKAAGADVLFMTEIYPAGESPIPGVGPRSRTSNRSPAIATCCSTCWMNCARLSNRAPAGCLSRKPSSSFPAPMRSRPITLIRNTISCCKRAAAR